MKILVLGASGMLGHKLVQFLGRAKGVDVVGTLRAEPAGGHGPDLFAGATIVDGVDAAEISTVEVVLEKTRPDVVVNAIGIVKKLTGDGNPSRLIQINALFPHQLAALCEAVGARLIHISTDCVFSGQKGGYVEDDPPDATDSYGRSKLLGEVSYGQALTLRTSIIGPELGRAHGLLEWFLGNVGKRVDGYRKAVFSGFTTLRLSRILAWVVTEHPELTGLYHVAAPPIDKLDLLSRIRDALGLDIDITPSEALVIDRSLDASAFKAATGFETPGWDDMIAEMAADMHSHQTGSTTC